MYSKHEASKTRQEFWTNFGQYLSPVPSSEGEKINWLNYKTGEKNILFRVHADNHSAEIAIHITHKDAAIRELYYEQFVQLKKLMEKTLGEKWTWLHERMDENGRRESKIYLALTAVNIYNREHWPVLISFFKPRLIALDEFWNNVKYAFESLR